MDDNTRDVLISLTQIGGGIIAGAVAVILASRRSRQDERSKWERDAKRELFARFMRHCESIRDLTLIAIRDGETPERRNAIDQAILDTYNAQAEISLLAPDLDELSDAVQQQAFSTAGDVGRIPDTDRAGRRAAFNDHDDPYGDAYGAFLERARREFAER